MDGRNGRNTPAGGLHLPGRSAMDVIDLTGDSPPQRHAVPVLRRPVPPPQHEIIDVDALPDRPPQPQPRLADLPQEVRSRLILAALREEPPFHQPQRQQRPPREVFFEDRLIMGNPNGPARHQHIAQATTADGNTIGGGIFRNVQHRAAEGLMNALANLARPTGESTGRHQFRAARHHPYAMPNLNYGMAAAGMFGVEEPVNPYAGDGKYRAPPPPREGFTRAPEENTSLICASCDNELRGSGDQDPGNAEGRGEGKGGVWIGRCGHVYCGDCVQKIKTKKLPGTCPVEGCTKRISQKSGMWEVYI